MLKKESTDTMFRVLEKLKLLQQRVLHTGEVKGGPVKGAPDLDGLHRLGEWMRRAKTVGAHVLSVETMKVLIADKSGALTFSFGDQVSFKIEDANTGKWTAYGSTGECGDEGNLGKKTFSKGDLQGVASFIKTVLGSQ